MRELTSIRIGKRTLRWIHRLKGLFERNSGKPYNIDIVIFFAVTFNDWRWAVEHGDTKKDYEEYIKEIEEKMGTDWSFEVSIIEEWGAIYEMLKK